MNNRARVYFPEEVENFILEELEYKNGHLYWKRKKGKRCLEKPAGTFSGRNRLLYIPHKKSVVKILEHRAIFWIHHGYWPKEIDHINRDPMDNRIENLREVSSSENKYNMAARKDSSTGIKNVYWFSPHGMYKVQLKAKGKSYTVGYFKDIELAELVAHEAREKYHGEFAYNEQG